MRAKGCKCDIRRWLQIGVGDEREQSALVLMLMTMTRRRHSTKDLPIPHVPVSIFHTRYQRSQIKQGRTL